MAAILIVIPFLTNDPNNTSKEPISANQVEEIIKAKENKIFTELEELKNIYSSKNYADLLADKTDYYQQLFDDEGLLLYVFDHNDLVFWSNNTAPLSRVAEKRFSEKKIIRLKNGWYYLFTSRDQSQLFVGLILLKKEYSYQNQYLTNAFISDLSFVSEAEISLVADESAINVFSNESSKQFYIHSRVDENFTQTVFSTLELAFFFLGVLCLIIALYKVVKPKNSFRAFLVYTISILGVRWITYLVVINFFPTNVNLFDPGIYRHATFFTSLADFCINSVLIFHLSRLIHALVISSKKPSKNSRIIFQVTLLLNLVFALWIIQMGMGLVNNSNISFDIGNLYQLTGNSLIALLGMAMLLFAFLTLSISIASFSQQNSLKIQHKWLHLLIASVLYILLVHFCDFVDFLIIAWPIITMAIVLWSSIRREQMFSFGTIVLIIINFAFYEAYSFIKYTDYKEKNSRVFMAEKLSNNKDPIAELQFSEIEQKLLEDDYINGFFANTSKYVDLDFQTRLTQYYFHGFWSKYDVVAHAFGRDSLNFQLDANLKPKKFSDLDAEVMGNGEKITSSQHLYHLGQSTNQLSYIAKLQYQLVDSLLGTIFIEFKPKLLQEKIGFPELLLDGKYKNALFSFSDYAYARYYNKQLVYQAGNYHYKLEDHQPYGEHPLFIENNGFDHLIYPSGNTTIYLSKPKSSILALATHFSYLFVFFSLVLLLVITLRNIAQRKPIFTRSLNVRLQGLIVSVVLVSLVLFGAGTQYYIKQQYSKKNNSLISEKINSVLIEVTAKLGEKNLLNEDLKPYMQYILSKFSRVFYTDINLYDLQGNLLATSRPKLFEEGLTSAKMNTIAFAEMSVNRSSEYIHEEEIGSLKYLSAYVPFRNKNNKILAYLNLPYFAKQNELEEEISQFLVAVINIFVLLMALSILAALFASNWITRPLKLLQTSLSSIELGKSNEPINYEGSDEVAALVNEYNHKVKELQIKAELLAQSERESAWREMAKQVAHEIKNPLTPIKLSVQHLQRSKQNNDENWDEKFDHLSQTLTEQIDSLTRIADEFSNFAKMPKPEKEVFDLNTLVKEAKRLYDHNTKKVVLEVKEEETNYLINADRNQVARVITNLIKNALEAIPEGRSGNILCYLFSENNRVILEIKDNGVGIDLDKRQKIFVPNFTTKTKGMGLGLAMVKNIVENSGGKIWFETEVGEGTSFFVQLPLYSTRIDFMETGDVPNL